MTTVLCAMAACAAVVLELPNGKVVRTVETNGVTAIYFELSPEETSFIRGVVALPPSERWNGRLKGFGGGGPANSLNDRGPIGMYFNIERGTYKMVGTKGDNVWIADTKSPNCRLVDKATKEEVGRAMDELMCRPPRRTATLRRPKMWPKM